MTTLEVLEKRITNLELIVLNGRTLELAVDNNVRLALEALAAKHHVSALSIIETLVLSQYMTEFGEEA